MRMIRNHIIRLKNLLRHWISRFSIRFFQDKDIQKSNIPLSMVFTVANSTFWWTCRWFWPLLWLLPLSRHYPLRWLTVTTGMPNWKCVLPCVIPWLLRFHVPWDWQHWHLRLCSCCFATVTDFRQVLCRQADWWLFCSPSLHCPLRCCRVWAVCVSRLRTVPLLLWFMWQHWFYS